MNRFFRRSYRMCCAAIAGAVLALPFAPSALAGEVAEAIHDLIGSSSVRERITLEDMGFEQLITLDSNAAARDIYVPVPAGIPLSRSNLVLKGRYIRGDGGRTTYTVAVDGNLVAARSPTDESGPVDIAIDVEGASRPSGFLRMGLNWTSAIGEVFCDNENITGNALQISPDSYFEYSYDPSTLKDISGVWSTLPREVTLLVSADKLDAAVYEAAWRLGVALKRADKDVKIVTIPRTGSRVDVTGLAIPSALASIPAFAALAHGGEVTLANDAEAGALLVLDASSVPRVNVAVVDGALSEGIKKALDAVRQQLVHVDAEAGPLLDALYERTNSLSEALPPNSVAVRALAHRPVIAVAPDAAGAAAGLFDKLWQRTAVSNTIVLHAVDAPAGTSDRVLIDPLNETPKSLDVVARGDWVATFDLGATLVEGKVPAGLDMFVSAAPGATATLPVASVFLNDYLLGAKQLAANGQPESISVNIPAYALRPRNSIRVQFQRQPASDRCRETPQAYPAAVHQNSVLRLSDAPKAQDFTTLIPHLAGHAAILVSDNWRLQASRTLPTVIGVASSFGVSPIKASFQLLGSAPVTPEKPFLAFDVPTTGAPDTVKVAAGRVSISDTRGKMLYDVAGMSKVAVLQALVNGKAPGLSFHTIGEIPTFENQLQLSRGDIAIAGEKGVLASVNSNGAPLLLATDGFLGGEPFSWEKLLDPTYLLRNLSWLLTVGLVTLFLILLLLARRARRRSNRKKDTAE